MHGVELLDDGLRLVPKGSQPQYHVRFPFSFILLQICHQNYGAACFDACVLYA